jgi:predicted helicase
LLFPELEEERDAAEKVKRETPIFLILGNPPYNSFAGVAVTEERELSTAYRTTKRAPAPQGQGLNDLYVRFFRMADRRIVERTEKGVVCFISNYSWLDGLSFTGMRERYLEAFDNIWVDCLNGDKYKTGKLTPDGQSDPSVFSTHTNPEGIQVETAIALLVRKEKHTNKERVQFRHFWGKNKRAELAEAGALPEQRGYEAIQPAIEMGLPFLPSKSEKTYFGGPPLTDLFQVCFPGVKTSRDAFLVDMDKAQLIERLTKYFDPKMSHDEMRRIAPGVMENTTRFKAEEVRDTLRKRGFLLDKVIRYCYRPFDVRWLYWEPETDLLDRKREDYLPHVFQGNLWLEARQKQPMERFDRGYLTSVLSDNFGNGLSSYFPLYLKSEHLPTPLLTYSPKMDDSGPNRSQGSIEYLKEICANAPDRLFFHFLAILHSTIYRTENAGALRQDWPRVPLPTTKEALEKSAALGQLLAELLDPEATVKGVTTGTIRVELRSIGSITRVAGGALDPDAGELNVTTGWGHAGKGGVTMPGKGKMIEREYTAAEKDAITDGANTPGMTVEQTLVHLGPTTCDIYLNDVAFWKNIPANVWNYTIGGYQVIKKWLSYREHELLKRGLTTEEAREVTYMTRRIAAILLLEPILNANYHEIKASTYPWPVSPVRNSSC